jgi:hypothetical protein
MLVHRRIPGMAPLPEANPPGRPLRTVIGDAVRRLLRATKPPARVGAGMGAIALQRLVRAVVWVNMYVAAGAGMALLYALGKARPALLSLASVVSFTVLAIAMVLAKGLWHLLLMPLQHVALFIVTAAVAVEALLTSRVIIQLAYDDNVDGLAGEVLSATEPIVEPFKGLEGTAILHDTGVVEFATLTAMEAVLVGSIAAVILLMFWSEFLHMYRRIRDFFIERAERRAVGNEVAAVEEAEDAAPLVNPTSTPLPDMSTAAADLSAAS